MRTLPSQNDYDALLAALNPRERMEYEAIAQDIASTEIDPTDPIQLEALAMVFAQHVGMGSPENAALAVHLAACFMASAHRLREGVVVH